MPPAVFNSFSTRPDGRTSRSPEPGAPTPSPRVPSPASRATPRGHISHLDAVTMSGDMLLPGCSGLVKTLPVGEEGISENFLSLWLSSLCIHVHPKKQPKALGFLIARHVRAVAHKVLRALHEHVVEANRRRQINKKAILHWMGYLCGDVMRLWRAKAVALRVARIRLRTVVSRWLRVELGAIFAGWSQQVEITRKLFVASERVSKRHQQLCVENQFKEWVAHLAEQEHRKNVLTKIVLRIQDRTLMKALQVWLQLASSLAIIKHLAEQGLRKYRTTTLVAAFQSWQDLRNRGFKAMDMMDLATAKWNKKLIEDCFAALRDVTQHTRMCNSRGLLIWNRFVAQEQRSVMERWKSFWWMAQRLSTIGALLLSKTNQGRLVAAFRGWATHVETIRTRYGLLRRGLGNHCVRAQRTHFAVWTAITLEDKVLRRTGGLISEKNDREVLGRFLDGWKDQAELSLQLLALHDKIEVKHNTAVAQDILSSWSNSTKAALAVRHKGLQGVEVGRAVFSRSKWVCLRGWERETLRVRQLEASAALNAQRTLLFRFFEIWIDNAAALRDAAARFERAYYRSEVGLVARFLSVWVDEHTRSVVRSNKLMTLMMVWDKRKLYAAFQDWVDQVRDRKHLRRFVASSAVRHMMARARAVLAQWGAAAYWRRLTRSKGEQVARRHLVLMAAQHLEGWLAYARSVKLADRGIARIRHRISHQLVSAALLAWAEVSEETSYKALVISRRDTKLLFQAARQALQGWAQATAETLQRARRLNAMDEVRAEQTVRAAVWDWWGWYRQQAALRVLRERCLARWLSGCGEEAFACWLRAAAEGRALRSKEASLERRALFRGAAQALNLWAVEAIRLKKLRLGLGRLVGDRVERTEREVLWGWRRTGQLMARHQRVAEACATSLLHVSLSVMLREWALTARELQRQWKGLTALTKRVEQRLVGATLQGWDAAVRMERMHARISLVIINRGRLSLARFFWQEWAFLAQDHKLFLERQERMSGALRQVTVSDVVFWWRKHTRDTRRRFEGLNRCLGRVRARSEQQALAGWFEVASYKRQQRATVVFARQKREWAVLGEVVDTMRHAVLVGRWLYGKVMAQRGQVAREVWDGWLQMCAELEAKRRHLSYILRRVELRAQAAAMAGWQEEVQVVKGLYGRAQVVEARNSSVQATSAVLKLLAHAKTRKRHRRLQLSFYQRWYVACLKNFFEAWRSWYGKKMAVKGVLDQVVEMM